MTRLLLYTLVHLNYIYNSYIYWNPDKRARTPKHTRHTRLQLKNSLCIAKHNTFYFPGGHYYTAAAALTIVITITCTHIYTDTHTHTWKQCRERRSSHSIVRIYIYIIWWIDVVIYTHGNDRITIRYFSHIYRYFARSLIYAWTDIQAHTYVFSLVHHTWQKKGEQKEIGWMRCKRVSHMCHCMHMYAHCLKWSPNTFTHTQTHIHWLYIGVQMFKATKQNTQVHYQFPSLCIRKSFMRHIRHFHIAHTEHWHIT